LNFKVAALVAVLIIVISLLVIGSIPVAAFGGSDQTVCTLGVKVTGSYNDYLFTHSIGDFNTSYSVSGCHKPTFFDSLAYLPTSENILPFTLTFGISLTAADGSQHCQCSISVGIPAGQTSYPFEAQTQIPGVPVGAYTLTISSAYPFDNGQNEYSTTVIVSQI